VIYFYLTEFLSGDFFSEKISKYPFKNRLIKVAIFKLAIYYP